MGETGAKWQRKEIIPIKGCGTKKYLAIPYQFLKGMYWKLKKIIDFSS